MNPQFTWLKRERSSTRLAFLMQTVVRLATAGLALIWTRLLLQAMGVELNGLWLTCLAIATLGGLGDLGMGGAVGIRVGRLLGQNDDAALSQFLASARGLFLLLATTVMGTALVLSPWLPQWLGFHPVPGSGSLPMLFATAAVGFVPIILNSYFGNLNYACGNLTWPIIPLFILSQAALLTQWLLARQQVPLWVQYIPFIVTGFISLALTAWFVRLSHPRFARLLPVRSQWNEWRTLAGQSFWMYFWSLGGTVYTTIGRLVVNAGFGPALVPFYHNNYKVCELAVFAISAASMAAMPKLTIWLAAPEASERKRGISELLRLNRAQIFLSCAAALAYLAGNDLFIRLWFAGVGDFRVPLSWQFAFALNLAITGAGDAAVQMSPRCSAKGLRISGIVVGTTALLNVALSFSAMKAGSILGVAMAAAVAQSFFSLWISRFVCGELDISWGRWVLRSWVLPIAVVSCAFASRFFLAWSVPWQAVVLLTINLVLVIIVGALAGITPKLVREELRIVRSIFGARH